MVAKKINPQFKDLNEPQAFVNHVEEITVDKATPHDEILNQLIEQFEPLNFQEVAYPESKDMKEKINRLSEKWKADNCKNENLRQQLNELQSALDKLKPNNKHFIVLSIEEVLRLAENNNWGLCKNHDFIYLFNGTYWAELNKETYRKFLSRAAEKMGVERFTARFYKFQRELYDQFLGTAYLEPKPTLADRVFINLQNGTFEISPKFTGLRPFERSDFITYQLPFDYNPQAKAPLFESYLNKVLPDIESQKVLAEYLGFVFIKHGSNRLKEEKALILYGTGANGKSVFFEVVSALLGSNNTGNYSLQSLTNENGYYRAKLANKLVNYASEINGKLESSIFKQLVSGEPVEARLPYGQPFTLKQYAKLIFNCNELPKDVEHTNAYFRRFLIVPFNVTVPPHEQDKQLHSKIIERELSGVFNWVLDGLNRLLEQKRFTECKAVEQTVEQYKKDSDSVRLFIDENGYQKSTDARKLIKELYNEYKVYCIEDGLKPVKKQNFIKRISSYGFVVDRLNVGNVVYLSIVNPY